MARGGSPVGENYVAKLVLEAQVDDAINTAKRRLRELVGEGNAVEAKLRDLVASISEKYEVPISVDPSQIESELQRVDAIWEEIASSELGGAFLDDATNDAEALRTAMLAVQQAQIRAREAAAAYAAAMEAASAEGREQAATQQRIRERADDVRAALRAQREAQAAANKEARAVLDQMMRQEAAAAAFQRRLADVAATIRVLTGVRMEPFDLTDLDRAYAIIQDTLQSILALQGQEASPVDAAAIENAIAALRRFVTDLDRSIKAEILRGEQTEETTLAYEEQAARGAKALAMMNAAQRQAQQHVVKTTLASQNVIRIIQDMPFGLFGITNNLQAMGESIGYLMQQTNEATGRTYTLGEAWRVTLRGLLTGPMAFSLVITLLSTWALAQDKIIAGIRQVGVEFGFVARRIGSDTEEAKRGVEELGQTLAEELNLAETAELAEVLASEMDDVNERINRQLGLWRGAGPAMQRVAAVMTDIGIAVHVLPARLAGLDVQWANQIVSAERAAAGYSEVQAIWNALDKDFSRAQGIRRAIERMRELGREADATRLLMRSLRDLNREVQDMQAEGAQAAADAIASPWGRARAQAEAEARALRVGVTREMAELQRRLDAEVDGGLRSREDADERYRQASEAAEQRLASEIATINRNLNDTLRSLRLEQFNFERDIEEMELEVTADSAEKAIRLVQIEYARRMEALNPYLAGLDRFRAAARRVLVRDEAVAARDFAQRQLDLQRDFGERMEALLRQQTEDRMALLTLGLDRESAAFFEARREQIRAEEALRARELDAEQRRLEAELELVNRFVEQMRSRGLDVDQETLNRQVVLAAEIEAIEDQRVRNREETTAAINGTYREEAEVAEERARRIIAAEREIQAVQDEIRMARAGRIRGTAGEISVAEAERDARRRAAEEAHLDRLVELSQMNADFDMFAEAQAAHNQHLQEIEADHAHKIQEIRRSVRQAYVDESLELLGTISDYTEQSFDLWADSRRRQLLKEGKTEEEANEIIAQEGRKRFAIVKAMALANAVANGIAATVGAYRFGAEIGGPPLGALMAATAALHTLMEINKLRGLTIEGAVGVTPGGGAAAVPVGHYTALNAAITTDRVNDFENRPSTGGGDVDRFEKAVVRFEEAAANLHIGDDAAESAYNRGQNRSVRLNQ